MIPWMGAIEDNLEVLNRGVGGGGDWSGCCSGFNEKQNQIKSLSFMREEHVTNF